MTPVMLDRYVGTYSQGRGLPTVIKRNGATLYATFGLLPPLELLPHSKTEFSLRWTAATVEFELAADGRPNQLIFHIGGEARPAVRSSD